MKKANRVSWTRSRKLNKQLFIRHHQHINAHFSDTWKIPRMESLKWPSPHKTQTSSEILQRQIRLHLHAGGTGLTWNAEMKVVRRASRPPCCGLCSPVNVQMSFLFEVSLLFFERKKEIKTDGRYCLCFSWRLYFTHSPLVIDRKCLQIGIGMIC